MKYEFEILQIKENNIKEVHKSLLFRPCPVSEKINLKENGYESVYKSTLDVKPWDDGSEAPLWSVLENIYTIFNIDHPSDYRGRSLSMSDIVKIKVNEEYEYHYCDTIGFTKVKIED